MSKAKAPKQPQPQQLPEYRMMPVVHQQVAGIDIGSKFHMVAIGDDPKLHVQQFGVSTPELLKLADHLKANHIRHVAMEATGGYERPLVALLQSEGFDVLVTAGANTKNYKRFKSDVSDAVHIRTLHQLGLLPPIFTADELANTIRPLVRLRKQLTENAADYIRRIQKALRSINVRLDQAFSDTTTKSGLSVIKAICEGQEDPHKLAELAHGACKKTKTELAELLQGNWTPAVRVEVQACYALYQNFYEQVAKLDAQLDTLLAAHQPADGPTPKDKYVKRREDKNSPKLPIQAYAHQILGTDLSDIPGLGGTTLLTILAELGTSIEQFATARAFARWLGLTPNNKASGGKILSRKTLKNKSALSVTLRQVANSIGNGKIAHPLLNFFKRIAYKNGRKAAITATARKLAVLLYKLLTTGEAYDASKLERSPDEQKAIQLKRIKKQLRQFEISAADLGFASPFAAA